MPKWKVWVMNKLLHSVCNTLTTEDMIKIDRKALPGGKIEKRLQIGKEMIKSEEIESLASEARVLMKMRAWKKLIEHMRSIATDNLVNKSKIMDDMVFSKAMLYTLQELEKVTKELSEL